MLGRRRKGEGAPRIDPFQLTQPWRRHLQAALQAQSRCQAALHDLDPGPLRLRLEDLTGRLGTVVDACWHVAQRGQALEAAGTRLHSGGNEAAGEDGPAETLARAQAKVGGDLETLASTIDQVARRVVALCALGACPPGPGPADGAAGDLLAEVTILGHALEETARLPGQDV